MRRSAKRATLAETDPTSAPEPDDSRKPESPTDLPKRSWIYVLRRTVREFQTDQCTDLAAALTYYAVLSIFPAAIALISLLGVVGQAETSVRTVLDVLAPLVSDDMLGTIEPTLTEIATNQGAGVLLIVGIAGAMWTASGYVGAFGRAMNTIYEIEEGRPIWKLRPVMLVVTVVIIVLLALALVMLAVSGPVAESIGRELGLESTVVTVWDYAKWPVLFLVVVLIVALLYYATPNVKQPKFRWLSPGAFLAIATAALASVGFTLYVAYFASYNATYGSLAGVVIALLFLWITNVALLLGAELDSELERGRELEAGLPAERSLQLPVRDSAGIEKAKKRADKDVERGRRIREHAATPWPPPHDSDDPDHAADSDHDDHTHLKEKS